VRFLLYNIRYGAGAEPDFHLPLPFFGYLKRTCNNLSHITKFIQSSQADIVGLLEVDSGSFRSRSRNQCADIADALGHYHVYQSKYANQSFVQRLPLMKTQGNAILTCDEIKAQKFHYFNSGIKRLVLELELSNLVILLVHLSLKFRHRQYQLSELYSLVNEIKKPVIVAGDFNLFRGVREVQLFLAATRLKNANQDGLPSYPSWKPRRQLDFIFHSAEIEITGFQVPRVTYSDHLPLICDFEITR
jgi:endonuclease/exonuclease/phosphatase family metal-dependent hydrolase